MIVGVSIFVEGINKIMNEGQVGVDLPVWQDREIRFDIPYKYVALCYNMCSQLDWLLFRLLKPRLGESVVDRINYVEDTKGNNGVTGQY